jgi:hypothetical protein
MQEKVPIPFENTRIMPRFWHVMSIAEPLAQPLPYRKAKKKNVNEEVKR